MTLSRHKTSCNPCDATTSLNFLRKVPEKANLVEPDMRSCSSMKADVDIDLREVYFLIMHFLSASPCKRTYGQFWNELLEHQLLPRRYHAWYSRSGIRSGDEDDEGKSLPLCYVNLVDRYPHVEKDHLVKLLKQLILNCSPQVHGAAFVNTPNAADVPTILGSGSFSLLSSDRDRDDKTHNHLPGYLRWPHMQADQVRGLSLREIGGGFNKHHRAPSVRAACYAIAKPSTMVQKMQFTIKLRGHQNAVYCATFDRLGRYVVTGSDDRLVKIWSMETAFCLASCRGHEGDITDLAVSSNSALVASSSNDFNIRVWRLPDGLPISVLRGHAGAVTAIAFSPRPSSCYQLLSSSDDGTCRIWDARYSQLIPRIYIPKPPDTLGKLNDPLSTVQQNHQILCCAFNASGTVFVTGSSDTYARVWNACRSSTEDSDQPNHEMDLLSGHENDVNYVQFSGCAVPSKFSSTDTSKEDNVPKFRNSWFTHDNIVTCSRDGSAIIWIPRSRRSHGKAGRWTRAYHLKVPPPPMPPQPPRGGPRQRFQPTPRGVNMIVWSLDNRFVLAAIMDCRICVWNASDGSLVHSLIGHTESTFVLDVHPFNPRIAMSAGYDGKTIIWDIWEGIPVRIYETGRFKLVDGKFSPDGTSLVLSDEVGQIFIIATGQGESRKDAQYDQFFLGDYRPLIQDTNGNVLDQETQLIPYRRNLQDLLCDSSMIPYPEPYQSMYQRRRLSAMGIEWRPPSVKFAVGPTYNAHTGDYQILPILDLDRVMEPFPEIVDVIDWEYDNELQSDDTDSEYNITDEYSSEGEHLSLSGSSSVGFESSADDSDVDHANEGLRRSKRKKRKSGLEITTSSGRRVKRRNLDDQDGAIALKAAKVRSSKNGRIAAGKKKSKLKSSRPQRRAARNALSFFSKITGRSSDGEEDEDDLETSCSESESLLPDSNTQSNESESSMKNRHMQYGKEFETSPEERDDAVKPSMMTDNQASNGAKRRLVLKLKTSNFSGTSRLECQEHSTVKGSPVKFLSGASNLNQAYSGTCETSTSAGKSERLIFQCGARIRDKGKMDMTEQVNNTVVHNATMKWGEVKQRSIKRIRLCDASTSDMWAASNASQVGFKMIDCGTNDIQISEVVGATTSNSENQATEDGLNKVDDEMIEHLQDGASQALNNGRGDHLPEEQLFVPENDQFALPSLCSRNGTELIDAHNAYEETLTTSEDRVVDEPLNSFDMADDNHTSSDNKFDVFYPEEKQKISHSFFPKLRIKTNGFNKETCKLKPSGRDNWKTSVDIPNMEAPIKRNPMSVVPEEEGATTGDSAGHSDWNNGSDNLESYSNKYLSRKYSAVYRRSRSFRGRKNSIGEMNAMDESTSTSYNHDGTVKTDKRDPLVECLQERRSTSMRASTDDHNPINASKVSSANDRDKRKSVTKSTVGLRSSRIRRENHSTGLGLFEKRQQLPKKFSWLMLLEHEEAYRYIPQKGDEVAYLRQGHEEYLEEYGLQEGAPWRVVGDLKAVEFCKINDLDYSTVSGSGESCCKLTLEFIDPNSAGFGTAFRLTLPELNTFPDFLVETTRYLAATTRNWTHRDKCRVWWKDANGNGGRWWAGRILAVKAKSPEFPDSPWERLLVQYKVGPAQELHSPWELHDADSQWDHPRIDEQTRKQLLSHLDKMERTSLRNQDSYGIQKLSQASQKSDFLNRFPAPLSLEVIKRRLENNYYRNVEAIKHDASMVISNAESYFARSVEMSYKIRRLADAVARIFTAL